MTKWSDDAVVGRRRGRTDVVGLGLIELDVDGGDVVTGHWMWTGWVGMEVGIHSVMDRISYELATG